jgi:hypothetical protein
VLRHLSDIAERDRLCQLHELLPRLSAEVTFNRRKYGNLQVSDQLGIGCDRFNGAMDVRMCQDGYLNYTSPQYDFFSIQAPSDPRLPGGGGYTIRGLLIGDARHRARSLGRARGRLVYAAHVGLAL